MDYWVTKIKEIAAKSEEQHRINPVEKGELKIHMIEKYVDDVFCALKRLKPGVRWNDDQKEFTWSYKNS